MVRRAEKKRTFALVTTPEEYALLLTEDRKSVV